MNELTIYECSEIIDRINGLASIQDGEITEEQLQELVLAQTTSIAKLGNLCGFMKHLEHGIGLCELEEKRIARMRQVAENRLKSIKGYLLPYLIEKGKPVTVGMFKLSTRKSTAVEISDPFVEREWCRVIPERLEPDKAKIGASLKEGRQIQGAVLVERISVQLK